MDKQSRHQQVLVKVCKCNQSPLFDLLELVLRTLLSQRVPFLSQQVIHSISDYKKIM